MSQVLVLDGQTLQCDASFKDDGEPPIYGMMGNQKALLSPGKPGHAEVFFLAGDPEQNRADQFFFKNGQLVTDEKDLEWISEPFRTLGLQFLAAQRAEQARAVTEAEAAARPVQPMRIKLPKRLKVQTRGEVLGGARVSVNEKTRGVVGTEEN